MEQEVIKKIKDHMTMIQQFVHQQECDDHDRSVLEKKIRRIRKTIIVQETYEMQSVTLVL